MQILHASFQNERSSLKERKKCLLEASYETSQTSLSWNFLPDLLQAYSRKQF